MNVAVPQTEIGVVVGRFQVHKLHAGHQGLIDSVVSAHPKVIVFLGVSPTKCTRNNPLDFKSRELMLREVYPDLTVVPIYDVPNDKEWSKNLDTKIREVFPIGDVTLYGSRDGFIPHYFGAFPTVELEARHAVSGSEIRKSISHEVVSNSLFRQGVVYSAHDKYPISYPTVDAAIVKDNQLLLARKNVDPAGKWRFVGGFVDISKDKSLEEAVKREVREETGSLGVGEPVYIGSAKIDDWRYRNEQDGIMTSLFLVPYLFGGPKADDDIDDLRWFDFTKLSDSSFVDEHKVLFHMFEKFLKDEDWFKRHI